MMIKIMAKNKFLLKIFYYNHINNNHLKILALQTIKLYNKKKD